MSTRCFISVETEPGLFLGVYCHWDGYPEGVGRTLLKHYNDRDSVKELLMRGSMSSLGKTIDECVFYEKYPLTDPLVRIDLDSFKKSWCEYWYRYRLDNTWEYIALDQKEATKCT